MFSWFKSLRKPKAPPSLFESVIGNNTCPDCGHTGFFEGPSGGLSTNIFCTNKECRSGFNITAFSRTEGLCDRISKGRDQYYRE